MPAYCGRYLLASKMRASTIAPAMWLLTIIPIAFIAFIAGFVVGRRIPSRLNLGEAMVANSIIDGLGQPYVLLNNVTLEIEDGTTQIDHILVKDTGIFVIETKHYTGWIFGNPKASHWTQIIYKKKSKFQNPVRQNYGHIKAIQSLFTLPSDTFSSLIVFTGDAQFKTDLGAEVIKLWQLIGRVGVERPVRFDERQMAYIVGRIEMKRVRRSIETDEYHINRVRQRLKTYGS